MSADFDPNKYPSPDFAKQEAANAKMGIGLFLLGIFMICRSVQVFSRVPGTCGPLFVLGNILCMIFQFWYCQAAVDAYGQDAIGVEWMFGIQVFWAVYGIFRTAVHRFRGYEFEFAEIGIGFLYRWMPNSGAASIGLASDMLVASTLCVVFHLFDSPVLGGWYLTMICCLAIGHSWLHARDKVELQRIKAAQSRAKYISQRLRR